MVAPKDGYAEEEANAESKGWVGFIPHTQTPAEYQSDTFSVTRICYFKARVCQSRMA